MPFSQNHLDAIKAAIVYATVWGALFAYVWTLIRLAIEKTPTRSARFVWTIGGALFAVHVLGAFDVFYDWSHAKAYEQTTLQTMSVTGYRIGWGLYLNYLFALVWIADLLWWWIAGDERYRRRHSALFFALHAFFLFMIFYGAFYFVDRWPRWVGLGLFFAGLVAAATAGFRARAQARRSPGAR